MLTPRHALILAVLLSSPGCGFLFQGTTQRVRISSTPDRATVRFAGVALTTPGELEVHRGEVAVLSAEKEGFRPACTVVRGKKNLIYGVLNSVPFGLGWIIDTPTRATYSYPEALNLELIPIGRGEFSWPLPADDEIIRRWEHGTDICVAADESAQQGRDRQVWGAAFDLSLQSVEGGRGTPTPIRQLKPGRFSYQEAGVEIALQPDGGGTDVRITNSGSVTLRVLWDGASFKAPDGSSVRAIHGGNVDSDAEGRSYVPSSIVTGAALFDRLIPVAPWAASGDSASSSSLYVPQMFRGCSEAETDFIREAQQKEGQTVKLVLPISFGATTRQFGFIFSIGKARLRHAKGCIAPERRMPEGARRPQPWQD